MWWFKDNDENKVVRGVVYMMKSRGPSTEPWGTPHKQARREDFCVTSIGWRCRREPPISWPWLSIGAYMAWHRRICATTCSVSQKWIGAGCVLQRLTPLSFQQPDSLLLVIVPSRSPAVAYGTVCELKSRPQQLCLFFVLVLNHTYFLFLSLHYLCSFNFDTLRCLRCLYLT